MPIPKSITVFNKHVTNRFFLLFSGWIPPLAVIEHHGRISGRQFKVPVLAFPTADGYLFALTYGRNVDWVRNLRSSGYGILKYGGGAEKIHYLQLIPYVEVKENFPGVVRLFLQIIQVTDCLMVEKWNKFREGS
jgi:hypothetical protein